MKPEVGQEPAQEPGWQHAEGCCVEPLVLSLHTGLQQKAYPRFLIP